MNWDYALPLITLATSLVTGIVIFFLSEKHSTQRSLLNMLGATLKILVVSAMTWGFLAYDKEYETRFTLALGFDFLLRVDFLSLAFLALSSTLWFVTTIYAIGYLEGSPHRSRFFGFFSLCVTATTGIALAGNLITFFIFYEFLTLVTYPLVVHRGTEKALSAGRIYLWYNVTGGAVLFVAIVYLYTLAGPFDFKAGGVLAELTGKDSRGLLQFLFFLLILGLGVKTALVPLHGWLPVAMVAPAPVSALLHAVAVVKAGAFGIFRVIFYVYGQNYAASLGVLFPLTLVAAVTILYASLRALTQNDVKKRLAYSTVSQVSYIILGATLLSPLAVMGGLVHLIHQGIMKITLFFCAGNLAETLNLHKIDELNGIGRRMPLTMGLFTIAAFGMMGTPPVAGFISKWYLALGGLQTGQFWVVGVLVVSTLLNAAYFLPVVYIAWFKEPDPHLPLQSYGSLETRWTLLLPVFATAFFSLAAGLWAGWQWSPLGVSDKIVQGMGILP
ncbi:proton-conducting transporter transmembrane domain-containing protein [Desulfocastanea catecholica]